MQVDPLLKEVAEMSEITFWSRQMAEHGLFISKALQGGQDDLRSIGALNLIQDGLDIYDQWMKLFTADLKGQYIPQQAYLDNLNILRNYLLTVRDISSKVWIGYAFPAEAEHYIDEANYYERLINEEDIPLQDQIAFWTDVHKDHAALFSRLLDPKEEQAFRQSLLYTQLFDELEKSEENHEYYLNLSQSIKDFNKFTATLREEQALGYLRSIINPRLALHIHREGLRAIVNLGL